MELHALLLPLKVPRGKKTPGVEVERGRVRRNAAVLGNLDLEFHLFLRDWDFAHGTR
jgi:hypothetical protein